MYNHHQLNSLLFFSLLGEYFGGEGGIRTPDRLAPMPHFECGAFDHSATSPGIKAAVSRPVAASSKRGRRSRQGTEDLFGQYRMKQAGWTLNRRTGFIIRRKGLAVPDPGCGKPGESRPDNLQIRPRPAGGHASPQSENRPETIIRRRETEGRSRPQSTQPHPFFFSFRFRMVKRALPRPVPMVRIPHRL